MPSENIRGWLAGRGWDMSAPVDVCHLDCARPGYRKVVGRREIILCAEDAAVLERGAWHGVYLGAPLPGDSKAGEWPWIELAEAG